MNFGTIEWLIEKGADPSIIIQQIKTNELITMSGLIATPIIILSLAVAIGGIFILVNKLISS